MHPIKVTDMTAFSTTHYHVPDLCGVEKATEAERIEDARQNAKLKEEDMKREEMEERITMNEQKEKARLRYNHALEKEFLKKVNKDVYQMF